MCEPPSAGFVSGWAGNDWFHFISSFLTSSANLVVVGLMSNKSLGRFGLWESPWWRLVCPVCTDTGGKGAHRSTQHRLLSSLLSNAWARTAIKMPVFSFQFHKQRAIAFDSTGLWFCGCRLGQWGDSSSILTLVQFLSFQSWKEVRTYCHKCLSNPNAVMLTGGQ